MAAGVERSQGSQIASALQTWRQIAAAEGQDRHLDAEATATGSGHDHNTRSTIISVAPREEETKGAAGSRGGRRGELDGRLINNWSDQSCGGTVG